MYACEQENYDQRKKEKWKIEFVLAFFFTTC